MSILLQPAINRLWKQLEKRRKVRLVRLLIIMVLSSATEALSIGTVIPFINALVSPEKLLDNQNLISYITVIDRDQPEQLRNILTIIFIIVVVISGVIRLILIREQIQIANEIGSDIRIKIYETTLYQPFETHITRNSSEIISAIFAKANIVVNNTLLPLITGASSLLLLTAILTALIVINPIVTIAALSIIIFIYTLVIALTKNRLSSNSIRISIEHNRAIKAIQEGLGGIRDIIIGGTHEAYFETFRSAERPLRRAQVINQMISATPRYLIETIGISMMAGLALALTKGANQVNDAIPMLAVFAIGAQRTLPLLQQVFGSWSTFRGARQSLYDVLEILEQSTPDSIEQTKSQQIKFNKSIKLKDVSFRYGESKPLILERVNLEITKGSRVGFLGQTGCGKSTILDIIMGLLTPTKGNLLVDEVVLEREDIKTWQSRISHVPQAIFLSDATVAENIAFGIPIERIDPNMVERAAKSAQIEETIKSWADKYNTVIGERGLRLSGGQRQRLGIARALYKQTDIIILDEATSALDYETEKRVIESINLLSDEITILMVTHRIETLHKCDLVVVISEGGVAFTGSYEEFNRGEYYKSI
jgi:ABC-type multidrug transport system fused ATPase/permease subunit